MANNYIFNRYLPALLYLHSTTPFVRASVRELLVLFFATLVLCSMGIRTHHLPFRKQKLYQLSYRDGILNVISWFEENSMKAIPDKFQAICIGKKTYDNIETLRIGETDIKCESNVSLLGINIDFMLKFDDHVTERRQNN